MSKNQRSSPVQSGPSLVHFNPVLSSQEKLHEQPTDTSNDYRLMAVSRRLNGQFNIENSKKPSQFASIPFSIK